MPNSPIVNQTLKVLLQYEFDTILDIGCGDCLHTDYFKANGKTVTSTDYSAKRPDVIEGDYLSLEFNQHGAVWCSHVLEHAPDTNTFLQKVINDCREGGVIAINVPPLKHSIVGGHVSLWNTGLLLYRLVLCGLDCSEARVGTYGYNCSVVVTKRSVELPPLSHGNGDLEKLSSLFPFSVKQGFNGQNITHNWI